MPPVALLAIAVLISLGGAVAGRIVRRQHRKRLLKLATEWRMNFSPGDQFRITPRVFSNFPVPGAAKIRVVDLIYGIDQDLYRYIFTAEYTAGVVSGKRRIRRAGSLSEPRDRAANTPKVQITLAPANLSLLDQYRRVHQEIHSEGQSGQGVQI